MRIKYLTIVSAVFLVIAMTIQFCVSYNRNKKDLLERIDYQMELTQRDFQFEVCDLSDATEEMAYYIPGMCESTDDIYSLLETVLKQYKDLFSCYVAFIPEYFPDKGYRFALCALRDDDGSIVNYRVDNKLDYFQREWYKGAMESDDNGYWSKPYRDINRNSLIFTHSRKAYDKKGNILGVACADYTLEWTKHLLLSTRPFDDAVCRLYSSDGTLIVETKKADWTDMITLEKVLSPGDMTLEIGVPKHHLWEGLSSISIITFLVLLIGILIAGFLVRRVWKSQAKLSQVETENQVMERELQIASNIQKGILKSNDQLSSAKLLNDSNGVNDVNLQALLVPMKEVGGDLYDFYRKGDDLFFIIGDVSGKSVTAAMMMSATINLFRSSSRRLDSPKQIMEELNAVLSENNPSMMFVTAFIGRLHIPTGELLYCNAGHLPPLIRGERRKVMGESPKVESLELEPNIPLGYSGQYHFLEQGTMLHEGESIILYTDGITEARNINRQLLGAERWKKIVESQEDVQGDNVQNTKDVQRDNVQNTRVESKEAERLLNGVKTFIGEAEPADDITLMVITKKTSVVPRYIQVENKMDQSPVLRALLHNYGVCVGLDKRTLKKMEVALEEAVVNVINYSNASHIQLTITHSPLTITITDDGIPFDPTAQAEVDIEKTVEERQIGGLGIALLRQISDELHYRRVEDMNQLIIIKHC